MREYLSAAPDPARKTPDVLSSSDPAAAWTAKAHPQVQFAYGINYLIDMDNAIIVDVEATPARVYDEVRSTRVILSAQSVGLASSPNGWSPTLLTARALALDSRLRPQEVHELCDRQLDGAGLDTLDRRMLMIIKRVHLD